MSTSVLLDQVGMFLEHFDENVREAAIDLLSRVDWGEADALGADD